MAFILLCQIIIKVSTSPQLNVLDLTTQLPVSVLDEALTAIPARDDAVTMSTSANSTINAASEYSSQESHCAGDSYFLRREYHPYLTGKPLITDALSVF